MKIWPWSKIASLQGEVQKLTRELQGERHNHLQTKTAHLATVETLKSNEQHMRKMTTILALKSGLVGLFLMLAVCVQGQALVRNPVTTNQLANAPGLTSFLGWDGTKPVWGIPAGGGGSSTNYWTTNGLFLLPVNLLSSYIVSNLLGFYNVGGDISLNATNNDSNTTNFVLKTQVWTNDPNLGIVPVIQTNPIVSGIGTLIAQSLIGTGSNYDGALTATSASVTNLTIHSQIISTNDASGNYAILVTTTTNLFLQNIGTNGGGGWITNNFQFGDGVTSNTFKIMNGSGQTVVAIQTNGAIQFGTNSQITIDASGNLIITGTTASTALINNASKQVSSLANGGANTVLHGTTPPTETAVVEADLGLTDITTANVSTSAHGFAPKAPNDATKYLDGTGSYSTPAGGGSSWVRQVIQGGGTQVALTIASPFAFLSGTTTSALFSAVTSPVMQSAPSAGYLSNLTFVTDTAILLGTNIAVTIFTNTLGTTPLVASTVTCTLKGETLVNNTNSGTLSVAIPTSGIWTMKALPSANLSARLITWSVEWWHQ